MYRVTLEEASDFPPETEQLTAHHGPAINDESLVALRKELRANEEFLQAANEELQTTKRELQSLNEELATLNSELQGKLADLSRANDDLNNLLAGTAIGTLCVDHHLCILRFTPSATAIVHLIPGDVGRPLGHLMSKLVGDDRLVADAQIVLNSLIPKELEVQTQAGPWYALHSALPDAWRT